MSRLLFVGDVVGKPGRRVAQRLLAGLIEEHRIDYTILNLENAAGGNGITPKIFAELASLPIDCFSSGNHIWDKREGIPLLDSVPNLLRPANYPSPNPGRGVHVGRTPDGVPVATMNLEGRVFMKDLDSPFVIADQLLEELDPEVRVILVDFHAEATSEKQAIGLYLDGRVSAVVGTHTHVPTADERILPEGTAFLTDVGMTGPYASVIGSEPKEVLERFATQRGVRLQVAKNDVRLAAVVVDVDETTGRARSIERLLVPMP